MEVELRYAGTSAAYCIIRPSYYRNGETVWLCILNTFFFRHDIE